MSTRTIDDIKLICPNHYTHEQIAEYCDYVPICSRMTDDPEPFWLNQLHARTDSRIHARQISMYAHDR